MKWQKISLQGLLYFLVESNCIAVEAAIFLMGTIQWNWIIVNHKSKSRFSTSFPHPFAS